MTDALLEDLDRRLAAGDPLLPTYKTKVRESHALLAQRFHQGARASLLVRQAAYFTDAILQRSWSRFLPLDAKASLIAVGGYGRGELHPASDVDVLILTSGDPRSLAEHIEPLVMFLWDIGLEIGHSVRSLAQCIDEARADITVVTNLVESRLLAGDPQLFELLGEATGPQHIWPTAAFFSAKVEEQRARHAKFDDSGQNLEPNLKEGPGGLRDIQTIGWVAKRHFGVNTMAALVEMQRLNEMLLQLFEEAILLNNELGEPVPINRRFQARNGYLEVVNSGTFARFPLAMLEMFLLLQQHPELQGVRASTIRLVRAHRHLIDGRLRNDIRARALFIEIFRQRDGLTHATRRMHRYGILSRYLPAFHAVTGLMQFDLFHVYTVDEHILMVIRNMRRFALERHVDECPRCNQVYAQLPKPELLYLSGLFHDIAKGRGGDHSELGAEDAHAFCLRHDLSAFDAELVAWLVRKHLVMSHTAQHKDIDDPEVIQEFAHMVGTRIRLDYLYLLTVADMRGTNPARWNSWKAALLDHLHARTAEALERGLDQPREQDEVITERQAEARIVLLKKGYDNAQLNLFWMSLSTDYFLQNSVDAIVWHTELLWPPGKSISEMHVELREDPVHRCTELFVYGPDRDDLFAHSAALLNQLGLNILSARIQTTVQGLSINTYLVLEEDGSRIRGEERLTGIRYFLEDGLNSAEPPLGAPRMPRQLKSFQMPSQIGFEQDETRMVTLLMLLTSDRPGLLSMVGQVFAAGKLRLHFARIATAGAEAQDTFAITDRDDQPISDPERLAAIAEALRSKLDD